MYTVEGNTSDSVARRTYRLDDSSIYGYGRPNWGVESAPAQQETPAQKPAAQNPVSFTTKMYNVPLPLLKKGYKSPYVEAAQVLLVAHHCDVGKYGMDGQFGDDTEAAARKFQNESKLEVDGEIGGDTWAALHRFGG